MTIQFDDTRWQKIKADSDLWWAGELERPLIVANISGYDPHRAEPKLSPKNRTAFYDFSVPAEDIVDRWDYDLSSCRFFGDGFPFVWPDFGPGVVAALLGARPEIDDATVWFHPPAGEPDIRDLHFSYNPDHPWANRIRDVMRAAVKRFGGVVQIGMTDLGGNLDILSSFRPGEKLLLDLYDHPDEVKRLTWEAHDVWWKFWDDFNSIIRPANPGYSQWAGFFSSQPHYMLQCDFCFMIGPDMFDEFAKPELAATCRKLTHAFYHLDGPGELPNLDSLLSIPELRGIQWIAGAGNAERMDWSDLYRKILSAGKKVQMWAGPSDFEKLVEKIGTAKGIVNLIKTDAKHEHAVRTMLEKFSV